MHEPIIDLYTWNKAQEKLNDKTISKENIEAIEYFKQNGRIISLPMKPLMESLNAGVSASVLMYTLLGKDIND